MANTRPIGQRFSPRNLILEEGTPRQMKLGVPSIMTVTLGREAALPESPETALGPAFCEIWFVCFFTFQFGVLHPMFPVTFLKLNIIYFCGQ